MTTTVTTIIKVKSSVSATLRTNRFTQIYLSPSRFCRYTNLLQLHSMMGEGHYMIYVCSLESYFQCISKLEMVEDQRQRDIFTQEKENAQTKVT